MKNWGEHSSRERLEVRGPGVEEQSEGTLAVGEASRNVETGSGWAKTGALSDQNLDLILCTIGSFSH